MRIKHSLRYCFVLLALATSGLFAEAAVESTAPARTGLHKSHKVARNGHRKHGHRNRNHKRYRRHVQ